MWRDDLDVRLDFTAGDCCLFPVPNKLMALFLWSSYSFNYLFIILTMTTESPSHLFPFLVPVRVENRDGLTPFCTLQSHNNSILQPVSHIHYSVLEAIFVLKSNFS